ncbi:POU-specific domain-containing protein [Aphis craccivora]|uniref:POU-specific domain-containing protein n=1 Tax=Aphis craccivora TaxID=307492 RepID=A0A6G0VV06_APHCR|nr:POU-specific domain-containing protein [Aphis craccivora]
MDYLCIFNQCFSLKLFYRKEFKRVLDTLINLTTEHLKITIETFKPSFNIFKTPFDKNTCFLENVASAVKLFPEMTNNAKIHDIDAIHAEVEILLNQCDEENVINIFKKAELSKSILPWDN